MIIKAYRTTQYKNWDLIEADTIYITSDPEDLTEEDRRSMRENRSSWWPVASITTKDGRTLCMPTDFIIEIKG